MERFFDIGDVSEHVKRGEICQKHRKMQNLTSPELQSVPMPSEVMKQIMVINGYKHLVVCIDHFSKLSEAKLSSSVDMSA